MADQIIGRVFVKVTPDTSKFREEAKAKLEKEEQRLPELTAQLHIEIDPSETAETVTEARAVRNAAQKAMEDLTLQVNLDDLGSVQSALQKINTEITKLGAIEIPVDLNEDSLNTMRDLLEERVKDIGVDVEVKLEDDASLKRAIAQIEAELLKLGAIKLNVDLNEESLLAAKGLLEAQLEENQRLRLVPEFDDIALRFSQATLALLTRTRDVVIRPVLDRTALASISFVEVLSGFRALRESIDQARTAFLGLFTNLPQIGAMTLGIVGLSGALLSAGGNAINLVGSLGQLLPIALAIPGIAIGFAATALALKDFGDQLPGITERFTALQKTISDGFWAIAQGPIANLLNAALPLLEAGLAKVSTSIGKFFAAFAGNLGAEGGFLSELPAMFDRLNESIQIFTGHTPALAQIMMIFGQIGSSILPPLADLIGKTADEFAKFLEGAVAGDGLSALVNNAIASLSGFIEILKGAFGIFSALFQATNAAGMSTFATLGGALQDFADTLASPEIQKSLSGLFSAASTMIENFMASAGPAFTDVFLGLSSVLQSVMPLVGSTLGNVATELGKIFNNPNLQSGLTSFITGLASGVTNLLPALAPIGDLIGALGPTLGLLATQIGTVLASLVPVFGTVLTSIQPVITMLSGALVQVLLAVSPLLQTLGETLATAFAGLLPQVQPVVDALVQMLQQVLPQLVPIVQQLAPLLINIATVVMPVLVELLTGLTPILVEILTAIQPLIPVVTDLIGLLVPILVPALTTVAGALVSGIGMAVSGVIQLIGGLIKVFTGVYDFLLGVFTLKWSDAWAGIEKIFSGILDIIVGAFKAFFGLHGGETLMGIWEATAGAFSAAWSATWGAVRDAASAIWRAIVSYVEFQIGAIVSAIRGIWGLISGAISALGNGIRNGFNAAMDAAENAVRGGIRTVQNLFGGLPGQIVAALGNLGRLLTSAGRQIVQSLIDGIQAMIPNVQGILNGLTNLIPDWKGPESTDRTLLYDAGQLIIDGLINGLESRYDAVRKSLAGLTKDVAGTEFRAPDAELGVNASLYRGDSDEGGGGGRTLNYYAAPGSSIDAEEDLFGAMGRARAWGF